MLNNLIKIRYVILLIGMAAMNFAGLNWQNAVAAWLAPICLLFYTRNSSKKEFLVFFILLTIVGFISQTSNNLFNLPVVGLINAITYSLIFTFTYLIDKLLYKKGKGFYSTLVFPAIYVSLEFLISLVIGISGIVAQSQFYFNSLAQLSSITGVFGISFVVIWFASILNWLFEANFNKKQVLKGSLIYGSIFMLIMLYGIVRNVIAKETNDTVKVATISGYFDLHAFALSEQKALNNAATMAGVEIPDHVFATDELLNKQIKNTLKAAKEGARIIVWNEDALILNHGQIEALLDTVKSIANEYNSYVLIAFLEKNITKAPKLFNNNNVLISSKGKIAWEYKKAYLAPAEIPIVNAGDKAIPNFDTEYGRIGSVICYDLDFPDYLQQASDNKIDILLVPSYDWESYADLHSKMAQFESLQSGFSIIRANGAGKNIVTDRKGNVIAESNTFEIDDKILYARLPLNKVDTIYSHIGNLFAYLVLMFLFIIIGLRITNK